MSDWIVSGDVSPTMAARASTVWPRSTIVGSAPWLIAVRIGSGRPAPSGGSKAASARRSGGSG